MKARRGSSSEISQFLLSLPLFSKLKESSARALVESCRFVYLEEGEILFFQSDPADAAYVVRSGRISIVLNSPEGREMVIEEIQTGGLLGDVGVLSRKPRSASALARTRSELLVIPGSEFLRVVDENPGMARLLLEMLAGRLRTSAIREAALAFMDAQGRLARHLLALQDQDHDAGYVTASQEDLARSTGLIRQTVAKALGKWRRDGWLLTGRGRIVILNRKALQDVEQHVIL